MVADLGPISIYIAMGIAVVKASAVALYFMHLKYDEKINGFVLAAKAGDDAQKKARYNEALEQSNLALKANPSVLAHRYLHEVPADLRQAVKDCQIALLPGSLGQPG